MRIQQPKGIIPRQQGCDLPPEYAEVAENINFASGRFEPWRQPTRLLEFQERVSRAHVRDCCWTGTDVCGARYTDAGVPRKTYLSAPDHRPVVTDSLCDLHWCFLGYPVPDTPNATSAQVDSLCVDAGTQKQTYRITYGTDCEEGPASCPTTYVIRNKDTRVTVSLPPPPDAGWCATTLRIYRLEQTWDSEQGLSDPNNPNAIEEGWTAARQDNDYYLIATLPIDTVQWVDDGSACTDKLLITEGWYPPENGAMIAGDTDSGSLVTWQDNEVRFSERNRYWAFPHKTTHCFPDLVTEVCVCGDAVFVITKAHAYLVQDSVDCKDSSERPVQELKKAPGGCAVGSCSLLPDGVIYSSSEGLVRLTNQGSVSIVSRRAFAKDDWSALGPNQIEIKTGCGHLFLQTPMGQVWVWELAFDDQGQLPEYLSTLSFCPEQWICDEEQELYFLMDNVAYHFNTSAEFLQMKWRQSKQVTTNRTRVSGVKGEYVKKNTSNKNTVSIYRNGYLSFQTQLGNTAKRLRGSATKCFQLEVKGNEPMCSVSYGAGLNEL